MAKVNFRSPRYNSGMPHIVTMLDLIGNDQAVADLLDLPIDTIEKYRRLGQAPRPVMYALFWETPWGWSRADVEAHRDAAHAYSWAETLKRSNNELRRRIDVLESELAEVQKAANAPFIQRA